MFQERLDNYKWLEKDRESKLLVYITGDRPGMEGQISSDSLDYFSDHLDLIGKTEKISLILYTRGGDPMTAWSLINLIRQYCNTLEVIIPSKARSSGTIICLGADNIMMTKQATLGPIDPSVNGLLNPQNPREPNNPLARVPVSVESIQGFIELAKKEFNLKGVGDLKEVLLKLTETVHPLVLGDVYRSRSQIQMVAKNLLQRQLGTDKEEKINEIIAFLCSDSGSHDYTIYRNEARNELGLNVNKPNDEQYLVIAEVFKNIRDELKLLQPFNSNLELDSKQQTEYSCRRVLIESISRGTDVYLTEGRLTKVQQSIPQNPLPPVLRSVVENQMVFEGWRHEHNNLGNNPEGN
jgi:hypothetical protein